METTIQVKSATLSHNREWYNIKTADNKEFSVAVNKNPKLKDAIEMAETVPYPLTGETSEKNGKMFLWDAKLKAQMHNKPFTPYSKGKGMNEKLSLAQTCINSACNMISESAGAFDNEKHLVERAIRIAEELYTWGLKKGEI